MFKDHYSKVRLINFLRQKSYVAEALKDVIAKTRSESHVIKELLSDNGGDFDNKKFRNILRANGIIQRLTAEQNGVAERKKQNYGRNGQNAKKSNLEVEYPAGMWAELCQTAVYILNRTAKSSKQRLRVRLVKSQELSTFM